MASAAKMSNAGTEDNLVHREVKHWSQRIMEKLLMATGCASDAATRTYVFDSILYR